MVARRTSDNSVFTIGYEGKTLDRFMLQLAATGVNRIVDVRALPLSRRRGFSKTALSEALASKGIEYVHLRQAGNPYRAEKDDIVRCLALYAAYLDAMPDVVADVEAALKGHRAALLCFEADAEQCHRSIIAKRLATKDPERRIRHL